MEKVWLKSYPQGIPEEISPISKQRTLINLLEEGDEQYGNATAYRNLGTCLSYRQVRKLSVAFAAFLQQELGLRKGEKVALMMPNLLQYPVVMFGILRAGLVVVNVNPLYTPRELIDELNDAGVKTIVVLANFAHTVEKALSQTQLKNIIVTEIGDLMRGLKAPIVNFVVKYIKKKVPEYSLPQGISFCHAICKGKRLALQKIDLSGRDLAFLQYTGGTTGKAKGAELSHYNILSNIDQCLAWLNSALQQNGDVVITALPLYHIFSLTVCCFVFYKIGGVSELITNPRDMDGFIKILKKTKFNVMVGVNTLFNELLNHSDFAFLDFSNLRLTIQGGMAAQKTTAERWCDVTGLPIIQGYGLTEASPVVTVNPLQGSEFNGSIGLPIPSTEIAILDSAGHELSIGEEGELCVKGPQVMQGYWQQPEETAHVFTKDGWLKTGDIAKIDEKGYVYLVDRKKDMILVSGFNVYPNEVEEVIASHRGVLEVGVVGLPSETSGEIVAAFIVKKDKNLTEEDIVRYCKQQLTPYKVPKLIEFRSELPKTPVGKILRRKLKK